MPQNSVKYTILQYLHVHWQKIAQQARKIARMCLHVFLTMHVRIEKHFSKIDHSFWCSHRFSCVEKKEGPRWIGSGACNLIVIACWSLVNASRHLRQTTYVGPLHNARDQDGGEGYHLLWDPTPSQGVITCCTGTHRLKMLT